MSKVKLLLMACLMVSAFSALASPVASAGNWMVNGTNLTTKATLQETVKILAHGKFEIPLFGVTLECLSREASLHNGLLNAPDSIEAAGISFEECTTNNTGGCTVPATISTVAVSGLATLDGPLNTLLTISPKTKNTFVTIAFKGEKCALKNETTGQAVTGSVHILIHEGLMKRSNI